MAMEGTAVCQKWRWEIVKQVEIVSVAYQYFE